jgi:hypothetical protein
MAFAADPALVPLTACEVLRDLPAQGGKDIAVLGRYSFRTSGRWIGEESCSPAIEGAPSLWLVEDLKDGPRPPGNFEIDAAELRRKFARMRQHTQLGKFRFGTPDYDRWAVIYGRVEKRSGEDGKRYPAGLVFRGSGVVVFITPED